MDDSLLLKSRGPLRRTVGGVGLGRTYEVVFGRIERLGLGSFVLRDLPSVAPGVSLIGGEVLRRFRVTFDFARERLLLVRGRHFAGEVPEDRSGLTLRLVDDGARLRVEEAESGSPAARAGIRVGEYLVEIDGARVRDLGLRRAQAVLMVSGAQLRLLIDGEAGARDLELMLPGQP